MPAEIFSLDFWVVERKHTFLVFTAIQSSSTEGTDTSLCCQLCIKTICRLRNNEKLADVKSVLKPFTGFVQTDISTASAK